MSLISRIYTENLNRREVLRLVSSKFDNFTLQPTSGYFRGKAERSMVIEVTGAKKKDVTALAAAIRRLNGQKSVLVITLRGEVKRIAV